MHADLDLGQGKLSKALWKVGNLCTKSRGKGMFGILEVWELGG